MRNLKEPQSDDSSDLSSGTDSSVGTPNPRNIERELFDLRKGWKLSFIAPKLSRILMEHI